MSANLEYYRAFLYVAEHQSFSKAAETLGLTQPSITKTIQKLEKTLGCTLFSRCKRGVELTPEGQQLYDHIFPAYQMILRAEEDIFSLRDLKCGVIQIGTCEVGAEKYLLPAMKRFSAAFPDVRFELHGSSWKKMAAGTFDLMVDFEQASEATESGAGSSAWPADGYIREPLGTCSDVLVGGKRYARLAQPDASMEEILACPAIFPARDSLWTKQCISLLRQDIGPLPGDLFCDRIGLRLIMAEAGCGITFAPSERVQPLIQAGKLYPINYQGKIPKRTILLFLHPQKAMSVSTQEFISILKKTL